MESLTRKTLRHRRAVIIVFLLATLASIIASKFVVVSYNMIDYLPATSPSTVALNQMNSAFAKGVPNLRVMVRGVDVPQALEYKNRLGAIGGVRTAAGWMTITIFLVGERVTLPFSRE